MTQRIDRLFRRLIVFLIRLVENLSRRFRAIPMRRAITRLAFLSLSLIYKKDIPRPATKLCAVNILDLCTVFEFITEFIRSLRFLVLKLDLGTAIYIDAMTDTVNKFRLTESPPYP